jgi:hypothetical protein
MLMPAKCFPQEPSCPRAGHCIADFARSHYSHAGDTLALGNPPVQYQATFDNALSFQAGAAEFPAFPQPLRF